MRILYNSKDLTYKDPFGTLNPGQRCTLRIHIPASVETSYVECVFQQENGEHAMTIPLPEKETQGLYEQFSGSFQFDDPGLYFYYFRITGKTGCFRLFKYGDDTNMEDGDLWQVSCVPTAFPVPQWAKGATIYQVFPDRFKKSGSPNLTGKLTPYTLHENWTEEVCWQPNHEGKILNNDFYGGNFRGITEKLDYIASLGVTILYLNPICKSFSNHRYDTGDYMTPDPMLGTLEDFTTLCDAAHARSIRVILDGVFSHTGDNSLYFDKYGNFGGHGAYTDPHSPYRSWYDFTHWPDTYRSWWGFDTLPTVNKLNPAFMEYIITGENSVIAHWLSLGCDGFRLDVADELPSEFLAALKQRLRQLKPDALLLGEVWEDASNKISYGKRCRYFVDGTLDAVMNYPFRTAILDFLWKRDDGSALSRAVMTIAENYPKDVLLANMNLLGSHDTPRILTALADEHDGSREEMATRRLCPEQAQSAREKLALAAVLQYALPGSPSIYYGDETGMEGGKDPFNRRTYPWGSEDPQILGLFQRLGALRKDSPALRFGDIHFHHAGDGKLCFERSCPKQKVRVYINRSHTPWQIKTGNILDSHNLSPDQSTLMHMGYCILEET